MRNFKSFKGRKLDSTKPLKVYRNLHNGKYSIKQGSLVVGHADSVALNNVTFKVNQNGRQKVLTERRKNVHAYVIGYISSNNNANNFNSAYYNPYQVDSFIDYESKQKLFTASQVVISNKIYYK